MEKLKEHGWYLSEQGYDLASDFGTIGDVQKIINRAIDMDLKEIGSGQGDVTKGNLILQIQKLRNISAPKYNEESRTAPRMLKLSLTDGKNNYQAVEIEHIPGIGLNTPPGTKLLLRPGNITLSHGLLLLGPKDIARVLNGKVPHLVEKWELNRKLATHSRLRSVEEGGPPPWIPFGKKIIKGGLDKNFKALGKDTDKETTEFEAQRQDAIAEAARLGVKKVFGGGNKQLLDHSVQRIVDQGFTVEQAEYALKINRNHVERALKSLQRTNDARSGGAREQRESREPRSKRFEKKTEETKPSSGKVSLFDFLEDKLPAQSDVTDTHGSSHNQFHHQRTNENSSGQSLESQFERLELRGLETSQAGKGGKAQKGGRGYGSAPRLDDSKYTKRSSHDNTGSTGGPNQTFGNSHQGKPPRFQRNQEAHGNYQADNSSRGGHPKFYGNDRRNTGGPGIWQSRGDTGIFNTADSVANASKNQRPHDEIGRNYQRADTRYQQTNNEGKSKYPYDSSRQTRNRDETAHRQAGSSNPFETNYKNQSNRHYHGSNETYKDNTGSNRNSNAEFTGAPWVWKLGDHCMAKYWEDNQYYNAQVTAISATTCVVRFKDFDNYEEVLQDDCIPITEEPQEYLPPAPTSRRNDQRGYGGRQARGDQADNHISGMEFRRGGSGAGSGAGNLGSKGYNKKRGQQRSAQPIYQPPAQRTQSSGNWNPRDNPPV